MWCQISPEQFEAVEVSQAEVRDKLMRRINRFLHLAQNPSTQVLLQLRSVMSWRYLFPAFIVIHVSDAQPYCVAQQEPEWSKTCSSKISSNSKADVCICWLWCRYGYYGCAWLCWRGPDWTPRDAFGFRPMALALCQVRDLLFIRSCACTDELREVEAGKLCYAMHRFSQHPTAHRCPQCLCYAWKIVPRTPPARVAKDSGRKLQLSVA